MEAYPSSATCRDIRRSIGRFDLFARLAPETLDALARASCSLSFQKDQVIYRAGDSASHLYVVQSGQVALSSSWNRRSQGIIELLAPGHSFGEAQLFVARPYTASAVAVEPSDVLGIHGDSFRSIMAQDPGLTQLVMKMLARRQVDIEGEMVARYALSGNQRLLNYLLGLAGPRRAGAEATQVTLDTSKKVLASRFDMQPESLSRNFRDLAEAGLIVVTGSLVTLHNTAIASYLEAATSRREADHPAPRHPSDVVDYLDTAGNPASAAQQAARKSRSHREWINHAGRQRMLSQRMAKSWLMLERGLLVSQSRFILKQSIDLFDSELRNIQNQADTTPDSGACAEVDKLWPRYRQLLELAPSRKAANELFRINEDVLEATEELTLGFEKTEGTRQGRLINLAGRERMLSQRMAKFFIFRHMGIRVAKCRSGLEETQEEFSGALAKLASATKRESRIAAELESVGDLWIGLQSSMSIPNTSEAARRVFRASENILKRLDTAVSLCVDLNSDAACPPAPYNRQPGVVGHSLFQQGG